MLVGTMQEVMAWALAHVTCLGSVHGHHVRAHNTCHGTRGGTRHVSWLDHDTMQGIVASVMAWEVARVMCHDLARGKGPWHGKWDTSPVLAQPVAPCKGSWHMSWHGR